MPGSAGAQRYIYLLVLSPHIDNSSQAFCGNSLLTVQQTQYLQTIYDLFEEYIRLFAPSSNKLRRVHLKCVHRTENRFEAIRLNEKKKRIV